MRTSSSLFAALLLIGASLGAAPITFRGNLSGLFENPINASPGTGFAVVVIDPVAHTLAIQSFFSGLLGTTTAAHIHCCATPPANAGVATQTPSFIGFPLGVTSGTFSSTLDTSIASTYNPAFVMANGGSVAAAEAVFFAGMRAGQTYFNIHTSMFPGGEIRGDLVLTPEPASLSLVSAALLGIAFVRRRVKSKS